MKKYILKRFIQLIPIILGITFLSFLLLYITPGDPAQKKLNVQGVAVTQEVLLQTRKDMGLDRPMLVQYADWLIHLLQGDMGISYKDETPVAKKLAKGFQYTSVLAVSALLLAVLISIPLGMYCALRRNRFSDYFIRFFCSAGNAIPGFLLAVLLIYFFCIRIKVFPVIARSNVQGLFLPVLALAVPLISRFVRQSRAAVLDELQKDYVRGAKARGVKKGYLLFFNVLHNAMLSIITVLGISIGTLMGGSVVIESIFMWPGIGKLLMDSITVRDYPVIQGYVILMTTIYVVLNLFIDISYRYFDPRVRE